MKQIGIYALALIVLLSACNNDKKGSESKGKNDNTKETVIETSLTNNNSGLPKDIDKRAEELKKLTPLTLAQLKAIMPAEIKDIPQSDFNGTSNAKLANASAKYNKDDKTQLRINIQDCANEAGYNIYRAQHAMVANASYATATEDSYFKAIDFMGGKATEAYNKKASTVDFNYIANDRLLITLSAKGMTPEEVKQLAQSLTFPIQ